MTFESQYYIIINEIFSKIQEVINKKGLIFMKTLKKAFSLFSTAVITAAFAMSGFTASAKQDEYPFLDEAVVCESIGDLAERYNSGDTLVTRSFKGTEVIYDTKIYTGIVVITPIDTVITKDDINLDCDIIQCNNVEIFSRMLNYLPAKLADIVRNQGRKELFNLFYIDTTKIISEDKAMEFCKDLISSSEKVTVALPCIRGYKDVTSVINSLDTKSVIYFEINEGYSDTSIEADSELITYLWETGCRNVTYDRITLDGVEYPSISYDPKTTEITAEKMFEICEKLRTFDDFKSVNLITGTNYEQVLPYYEFIKLFYSGDINGDMEVTAVDASLAFSEYKKIYREENSEFTSDQLKAADINGDGKITAADASKIFTYYKEYYKNGSAQW